jgi:EAL domain-containing protein (putative c-di-GMP-specific phosphodiesterase class I)
LLTSAIAGLARDLGIETIATGVDRPDQAELLQSMGCGLGQGDWLARQLPASAVGPAGHAAGWTGDPACSPAS